MSRKIVVADSRQLVAVVMLPTAKRYYNPSTGGWETPFNPAAHTFPFSACDVAGQPGAAVQSCDLGNVLDSQPDAAALVAVVDPGNGTPTYTVTDVWTIPNGRAEPLPGGFVGK